MSVPYYIESNRSPKFSSHKMKEIIILFAWRQARQGRDLLRNQLIMWTNYIPTPSPIRNSEGGLENGKIGRNALHKISANKNTCREKEFSPLAPYLKPSWSPQHICLETSRWISSSVCVRQLSIAIRNTLLEEKVYSGSQIQRFKATIRRTLSLVVASWQEHIEQQNCWLHGQEAKRKRKRQSSHDPLRGNMPKDLKTFS